MRLTFQGAMLSVGKGICEYLRGVVQHRRAVSTTYQERGDRDGRQLFSQHQHITHDSSIIDERVRYVFERRPEWRMSKLGNDFGRNTHHLCLVQFDRITSTP